MTVVMVEDLDPSSADAGVPANADRPVEAELDLVDLWAPVGVPWSAATAVATTA